MPSFRRAVLHATAGRYLALAIGIAGMLVLARLLRPEEIGVFSVGAAVLAIVHVFRDFGVSQYVVREPDLTDEKLGTCVAIAIAVAWVFALALAASAPAIARFYEQPGLAAVIRILALGLAVIPFNSIRMALLRREMRFGVLLGADVASAFANTTVAIGLALLGYSYLSLAWGAFASIVATLLAVQVLAADVRQPRPRLSAWRGVTSFGGTALGLSLVTRLGNNFPDFVIGKASGMFEVGILSRARGLVDLLQTGVLNTIGTVAFSEVSRKHRQGEAVGPDYLQAMSYVAVIAWPCYGFLMLNALPIIRLLFGPNWDASAPLAEWLAVAGLFAPVWVFNGQFLTAIGRIGVQLRIQSVSMTGKVAAWALVIPYSLHVALGAYVCVHGLGAIIAFAIVSRLLDVRPRDALARLVPGLAVTAVALAGPVALRATGAADRIGATPVLLVAAALLGTGWLVGVYAFGHPVRRELDLARAKLARARG